MKCYGNGKCIKKRSYGYYKPYKCEYYCKLVSCQFCNKHKHPQWLIEKNYGHCPECLRIYHNEKYMQKIFVR